MGNCGSTHPSQSQTTPTHLLEEERKILGAQIGQTLRRDGLGATEQRACEIGNDARLLLVVVEDTICASARSGCEYGIRAQPAVAPSPRSAEGVVLRSGDGVGVGSPRAAFVPTGVELKHSHMELKVQLAVAPKAAHTPLTMARVRLMMVSNTSCHSTIAIMCHRCASLVGPIELNDGLSRAHRFNPTRFTDLGGA